MCPIVKLMAGLVTLLSMTACVASPPFQSYDYTAIQQSDPRSILVVPVVNNSNETDAADYFLTTIAFPLAERGFYVFPTNLVKRTMEADGLGDAGMVHQADPVRVAELFGADSVLFVEINKWESQYQVLAASIVVDFKYRLVDGKTGALVWQRESDFVWQRSGGSGNLLGDLIATAITSAMDSVSSDYTALAYAANNQALLVAGRGLPPGPYSPTYQQEDELFPSTGTAWVGVGDPPEVNPRTGQETEPAEATKQTEDEASDSK